MPVPDDDRPLHLSMIDAEPGPPLVEKLRHTCGPPPGRPVLITPFFTGPCPGTYSTGLHRTSPWDLTVARDQP